MLGDGILRKIFFDYMSSHTHTINVLPKELKGKVQVPVVMYPGIKQDQYVRFQREATELNESDDAAYNIVVLGPTGSGKSTVINNIFNKTVCATAASAQSVTREVKFYRGEYHMVFGREHQRKQQAINIIDTIGKVQINLVPIIYSKAYIIYTVLQS